jgi:hypothetical protein
MEREGSWETKAEKPSRTLVSGVRRKEQKRCLVIFPTHLAADLFSNIPLDSIVFLLPFNGALILNWLKLRLDQSQSSKRVGHSFVWQIKFKICV